MSDPVIIITIPPKQQNLKAEGNATRMECHLLAMLDQLLTGRDHGYTMEIRESDG